MDEDEAVLKKFIVQKLKRVGSISVQNLTGHLSQLPVRVRESSASSKQHLLKFLRKHPTTFSLASDGYVNLVVSDDKETRSDSCNTSVSSKGSHAGELPNSINNGKGKIVKLFPMFGFIKAEEPFKTSVYFTALSFGDKNKTLLQDCGVTVGQTLCFDAKLGNSGHDAKYRAIRTWISKSGENASLNTLEEPVISTRKMRTRIDNGLYDPYTCEGEGPVQKIFQKYGFIAVDGDPRNTIFFAARNICNYKNVVDLTQILTIGDTVDYSAIRSTKHDSNARWEATQVYIKQVKKKISIPNDSDDEKFVSGPDDEIEDKANGGASPSLGECEENSVKNGKPSVNSSSHKQTNTTETKPPLIIHDCTGKIYIRSGNAAVIKFGKGNSGMAVVDTSAVYIYGSRVKELVWEVEDGQNVFFNARKTDGPPGWQTLLVWIGSKPENVEKLDGLIETSVVNKKYHGHERDASSKSSIPKATSSASDDAEEFKNWADAPYSEEEEEVKDLKCSPRENSTKESCTDENKMSVKNVKHPNDFEKMFDVTSFSSPKKFFVQKPNCSPVALLSSRQSEKVTECGEDVDSGNSSARNLSGSRASRGETCGTLEKTSKRKSSVSSGISVNSSHNEETTMDECADDEESDNNSRFYTDSEDELQPSEVADVDEAPSAMVSKVPVTVNASESVSKSAGVVHAEGTNKKEVTPSLVCVKSDRLSASIQNIPGWSSRMGKKLSLSDVRNVEGNNENPSRSVIDKFCGISGRIKSLFIHYGEVTCGKLRKVITFYAKDFYINERPVGEKYSSLKDALKVDEVVFMNCYEIVDDSNTVWQKVTLIWKGKKPRGCKEMLPEEFIKQYNLKVSCLSAPKKSRPHSPDEQNLSNNSESELHSPGEQNSPGSGEVVKHLESPECEESQRSSASKASYELSGLPVQPHARNSNKVLEDENVVGDSLNCSPASLQRSNPSSSESLNFSADTMIKCDSSEVKNFQVNCDEVISPLVDTQEKCETVNYIAPPVPLQRTPVANLIPLQGGAAVQSTPPLQEASVKNSSKQKDLHEDSITAIASAVAKLINQPTCSRCSCRKEMSDKVVQTEEMDKGIAACGTETEVKTALSVCDSQPQCLVSTAVQTYSTGEVQDRKKWVEITMTSI